MALWEKDESQGWDSMGAPLQEEAARRDMELHEGIVAGQKIQQEVRTTPIDDITRKGPDIYFQSIKICTAESEEYAQIISAALRDNNCVLRYGFKIPCSSNCANNHRENGICRAYRECDGELVTDKDR